MALADPDEFWNNVLKTADCWLWLRGHDKDGYGTLRNDSSHAVTIAANAIPRANAPERKPSRRSARRGARSVITTAAPAR